MPASCPINVENIVWQLFVSIYPPVFTLNLDYSVNEEDY